MQANDRFSRTTRDCELPMSDGIQRDRAVADWADDGGNPQLGELRELDTQLPGLATSSDSYVQLLRISAGDEWIANSARVSNAGDFITDEKQNAGLINALMRDRHGVPFESGYVEVKIGCPLFVAGQILRHRIGWSFSVKSGRYGTMGELFYLPSKSRPLKNIGTSMRPRLSFGETPNETRQAVTEAMLRSYEVSFSVYRELLDKGVTNEVARLVLPEGIFTELWARTNPRGLMHFLSLRVDHEANTYKTHPQFETQAVAHLLEMIFEEHWPITHAAWMKYGRVAP